MSTEIFSPRFADIACWPTEDAVMAMLEGQLLAVACVRSQIAKIAQSADAAAARLRTSSARLVYAGAGTSGRIAVQDGVELAPTYGWSADRLVFALAGGLGAITATVEGAEDDGPAGSRAMRAANIAGDDVVIGVAASGSTAYTVAAIEAANAAGALTIGIASNLDSPLLRAAQHKIWIDSGTEVIAGSTRMKAGTAQKVVLNLLSTAIMIRLGRVYAGLMVDMRPSNDKLHQRAVRMVVQLAGVEPEQAAASLAVASGNLKLAVLHARGIELAVAQALLLAGRDDLATAMRLLEEKRH